MRKACLNPGYSERWLCSEGVWYGLEDNYGMQQEFLLRLITFFVQVENIDKMRTYGKVQIWYLFANALASSN